MTAFTPPLRDMLAMHEIGDLPGALALPPELRASAKASSATPPEVVTSLTGSPEAELAATRAQVMQSLQTSLLAMIDYVAALEVQAEPPATAVNEMLYLYRTVDAVSKRFATLFERPNIEAQVLPASTNAYPAAAQGIPSLAKSIFIPAKATKLQGECQDVDAVVRKLSPREISVLTLLVQGLPNKLIAYELGISVVTVKAHIGTILRKMNVHSRNRVIALLANIDLSAKANLPDFKATALQA